MNDTGDFRHPVDVLTGSAFRNVKTDTPSNYTVRLPELKEYHTKFYLSSLHLKGSIPNVPSYRNKFYFNIDNLNTSTTSDYFSVSVQPNFYTLANLLDVLGTEITAFLKVNYNPEYVQLQGNPIELIQTNEGIIQVKTFANSGLRIQPRPEYTFVSELAYYQSLNSILYIKSDSAFGGAVSQADGYNIVESRFVPPFQQEGLVLCCSLVGPSRGAFTGRFYQALLNLPMPYARADLYYTAETNPLYHPVLQRDMANVHFYWLTEKGYPVEFNDVDHTFTLRFE